MQECILDEGPEKENGAEEASVAKSLSKSKKSSVIRTVNEDPGDDLVFQVSHKVSYKTVLKGKTPPCTFVLSSILIISLNFSVHFLDLATRRSFAYVKVIEKVKEDCLSSHVQLPQKPNVRHGGRRSGYPQMCRK